MSQSAHNVTPKTDEVPREILELVEAVRELPPEYAEKTLPLVERVVSSAKRRRRILHLVQDALSQLRLDMKYLMFDLEATRRERDEYRRQIDGS